ncbi:MAG: 5'-nucleotidase C-terminal domain-containing protein [Bacteroidia bacterium]|nr:5'-nucleotidase C-terminal domain-containing protein [Bacteroidia bacterium]
MISKVKILLLLLFISFNSCKSGYQFTADKKPQYKITSNDTLPPEASVIAFLQPYKLKLDSSMNIRLASSDMEMEKGQPESLLGNFVSDLCMNQVKPFAIENNLNIDFCFFNNGGLRNSLPKGDITMRNIFELMPFDNELVILIIDGKTTEKLIKTIIEKGGVPVSGIRIILNKDEKPQATVQDKPFDTTRDYVILTSDYLAGGGDQYDFLKNRKEYLQTGLLMRDAIINHCRKAGKISSQLDNRIRHD